MKLDNFLVNRLLSTQIVTTCPGLIISKSSIFFGKENKKRVILTFESTISNLHIKTIEKIGKEEAQKLWYNIGKIIGTSYFKKNKVNIPNFLIPKAVTYLFRLLSGSVGSAYCNGISFKKEIFRAKGKDNPYCKNSHLGSMVAGLTAGILSAITKKGYSATVDCSKCPNCKINAIPDGSSINIFHQKKDASLIDQSNFPKNISYLEKFNSYDKLVRFKKIKIHKNGEQFFMNKRICPTDSSFLGTIAKEYEINKIGKLFFDTIRKEAYALINTFSDTQNTKKAIFKDIISTFGRGLAIIDKKGKKLDIKILYPPFNENGFTYESAFINGCLDAIYDTTHRFISCTIIPSRKMAIHQYDILP